MAFAVASIIGDGRNVGVGNEDRTFSLMYNIRYHIVLPVSKTSRSALPLDDDDIPS
jgi:hypothetical protein